MTGLAERLEEADRAAAEHIAAVQRARRDVETALAQLESLVGNQSPPDGRFGHVPKPNGRAKGRVERRCAKCSKPFVGRGRQKYCGRKCSRAAWDRRQRAKAKPAEQGESEAPSGASP